MATCTGERASPIAVLLADLPGVLAALLAGVIAAEADLRLVGVVSRDPAALAVAARDADVLIVGGPPPPDEPAAYTPLLRTRPELRIMVVTTHGDEADLYWMGLCHRRQPSASAPQLADAVRAACAVDPYRLP